MSSPIYTSEAINNVNPRWSSLEVPTLHATGYSTASGERYKSVSTIVLFVCLFDIKMYNFLWHSQCISNLYFL